MGESFAIQGYSASNMIMCFVDGENIVQQDYIGNRQIVGKTAAAYAELEQTTQEYYNKLVELGVIVPPKTPEDTMAEMQKNMDQLTNIIAALAAEVKEMKGNGSQRSTGGGNKNVSASRHIGGNSEGAGDSGGDA
jgi:hypothetical protein